MLYAPFHVSIFKTVGTSFTVGTVVTVTALGTFFAVGTYKLDLLLTFGTFHTFATLLTVVADVAPTDFLNFVKTVLPPVTSRTVRNRVHQITGFAVPTIRTDFFDTLTASALNFVRRRHPVRQQRHCGNHRE